MSKQDFGRMFAKKYWIAWSVLAGGAAALATASWMTMPVALSQSSALARWTFNTNTTNFGASDGVLDTAGLPAPTFNGDPAGSPGLCSDYPVVPPHSGSNSNCMYLDGSSYVSGNAGENLFPNSETGNPEDPPSGTNDGNEYVHHYDGSRTLLAWVRIASASWVGYDRALISIGRDHSYAPGEYCDSVDPGNPSDPLRENADPDCTGFGLWVNSSGQFVVGNSRGSNVQSNIGPTLTCSDPDFTLDSDHTDTWFFVAATFNINDASDDEPASGTYSTKIYVNGQLCNSGNIYRPYTEASANSRWAIGGFIDTSGSVYSNNTHPYFHGFVDDVRVFDRAMSVGELAALYASNNNGG